MKKAGFAFFAFIFGAAIIPFIIVSAQREKTTAVWENIAAAFSTNK